MKHGQTGRKFGRVKKQRVALLRSLARSLVLYNRIETTESKAKELRPFIEKLVSKGKLDTLFSRRLVTKRLGNGSAVAVGKIFATIAPKFKDRKGGYTRITKTKGGTLGQRRAVIEFVE